MRRGRALLLAIVVLLLAVPVGLVLALPWLAEPGLRLGLRQLGLGEAVAFEDVTVRLGWAELVGLRVGDGPDLTLERVRLAYGPGGLARGRLREARLEGLVLRGRLDETGGLHLDVLDRLGAGDGAGDGVTPVFPVPERVELVSGRIELATPFGEAVLPVSGEAHRVGGGRVAVQLSIADGTLTAPDPAGGEGNAAAVALRADLEVAGEVAVRALPRTEAVTATGTLDLMAEDLRLPGLDARVTGGGPIRLALGGDVLTARFEGFGLELVEPGPALAPLAELAPPPLTLTLGTDGAAPLEVTVGGPGSSPRETGLALRGPAALAGGAGGPRLTAEVGAALTFGADDAGAAPFRVEPDSTLSLAATDLSWHRLILPRARLAIEARGVPGHDLHAALDLDLSAEGEPVPGLGLDGGWLRLPADLELADGRLTLRPRAGARLGAAAFRWRDAVRGGPVELALDEGAGPLLTAPLRRGVVPVEPRYRLALLPAPFGAELRLEGAPLAVRGTTPRLDLDLEHPATGRLLLAGAAVEIPAYRLAVAEAGGELRLSGGGLARGAPVPVAIGAIRHTGDPAWFRPLALRGVLRPEEDGRLGFQAEVTGAEGRLAVDLRGRHDPATGAGSTAVRMAPLEFGPADGGGLQPAQLSPLLARAVSDVAGWLDVDGTVAWGPGRPRSDLALLAHDLSLTAGPARLERINAAIRFDSLAPPTTPPGQLAGVALLDVGLPLVNGEIEFRLREDGAAAVEQARWRWAGGEIRTGAFVYHPGEPVVSLTLQARALDIAQLLEQVRLGGLEGTGRLSGALPVRIEDGVAVVDGGELRAEGPGWLRYRPQETPAALQAGGEGVTLMLQALENFRYEALRITLDGRTDSEMQVGLHLSGANPQLYGGYPVEFNLNLEGELGAVIQAGIEGYSLPDRIAERMGRLRR